MACTSGHPLTLDDEGVLSATTCCRLELGWQRRRVCDDMTTEPSNGSPRSTQSSCESCEHGPSGQRILWADMADSDDDVDRHHVEDQSKRMLRLQPSHKTTRQSDQLQDRRTDTENSVTANMPLTTLEQPGHQHERTTYTGMVAEWKSIGKGGCEGKGKSTSKCDKRDNRIGVSEGRAKLVGRCDKHDSKGKGKNGSKGACRGAMGSTSKEKGKGRNKGMSIEKWQCQFILGIGEDPKFRVAQRILGSGGVHMKNIAEKSGARLRLRGRGSKFLEGPEQKESEDDLMLCVSCEDWDGYEIAKVAVSELLESIYAQYRIFRQKAGQACPNLQLQMNEGYREGSR